MPVFLWAHVPVFLGANQLQNARFYGVTLYILHQSSKYYYLFLRRVVVCVCASFPNPVGRPTRYYYEVLLANRPPIQKAIWPSEK